MISFFKYAEEGEWVQGSFFSFPWTPGAAPENLKYLTTRSTLEC